MAEKKGYKAGQEGKPVRTPSTSESETEGSQETSEVTDADEFHNYKPPRRLLLLELIVIILLIILLLFEPNGFSAISMKGTDTVGLLSTLFPLLA